MSRRWVWHHVDEFSKHFRTSLHVVYMIRDYIYDTQSLPQLLTSGLAKNSSKKTTMCSCSFLLASSTRKDRCKYKTQFYSCSISIAVVTYPLFHFSGLDSCLCKFNKCMVHAFNHVPWIPWFLHTVTY